MGPLTSGDYWRQTELVGPDQLDFPVVVVGAGGIGSPVTLALAKMGCSRLTVLDPDLIEAHNLPSQLYRLDDLGRSKVQALAQIIQAHTGVSLSGIQSTAPPIPDARIVVGAVDSMHSRRQLWNESVRFRALPELYLDARMGGEVGRLLAVTPSDPDDVADYEATLFDDAESDPDPCSNQSIIYAVLVLAGLIAGHVRRHAVGERMPRDLLLDLATFSLLAQGRR